LNRVAAVWLAVVACAGCSTKRHDAPDAATTTTKPVELPPNQRAALTPDNDLAITGAQDVVRRDTEKNDPWIALGRLWLKKGVPLNAEACASVVLGRDPDHAGAADLESRVLMKRRDYEEARKVGERITGRRPNDAVGWGNLSDALLELGRYDEANDAAQKMLELAPGVASHRRVAYLEWLHGDIAGAKKSIKSALDAGGDPEALAAADVQSGMMAWHAGDYDGASAAFDEALRRIANADFVPALIGRGRVALARGETYLAVEQLSRADTASPSVETAWLLADALAAGGLTKEAEKLYRGVPKEAASDPRTYSLFLTTKKDPTKEERDEALRLAGGEHVKGISVYTEDAMAWALYRAGMLEAAKTTDARARRLHTPDALLIFHEGAIRIAAGDTKKGKELVAKALALNPAFDWRAAREAKELLK